MEANSSHDRDTRRYLRVFPVTQLLCAAFHTHHPVSSSRSLQGACYYPHFTDGRSEAQGSLQSFIR